MFFANDKNGNRISAEDAIVGEKYFCPTCNTELILKPGIERQAHFAHKVACSDHWYYEMSEWHQRMQGYFLPKYREVVVEHNGEKHRADVLIPDRHGSKSLVIEFQHSNMSREEFFERNVFYKKAGYNIIWVFDINNPVTEKFLSNTDDYIFNFKWNCPYACLKDYKYYTNKDKLPNKVLLSYYDDGDDILFLFEQYNIFSRKVDVDCTWHCGGSFSMFWMRYNSVRDDVGDRTDAAYFFDW